MSVSSRALKHEKRVLSVGATCCRINAAMLHQVCPQSCFNLAMAVEQTRNQNVLVQSGGTSKKSKSGENPKLCHAAKCRQFCQRLSVAKQSAMKEHQVFQSQCLSTVLDPILVNQTFKGHCLRQLNLHGSFRRRRVFFCSCNEMPTVCM